MNFIEIHQVEIIRQNVIESDGFDIITTLDDDRNWTDRFEHHLAGRMIQLAGCIRRGEAESSHQSGQHDFNFEHSVLLADAVARSGAERNESVRMSSGAVLRKEAFRLELIRIFVNLWIAMHSVDQHGHGHT
jgi:hypothetical protein